MRPRGIVDHTGGTGFVSAIEGQLGDDARAAGILGAVKGEATLAGVDEVAAGEPVLSSSRSIENPDFPDAVERTLAYRLPSICDRWPLREPVSGILGLPRDRSQRCR